MTSDPRLHGVGLSRRAHLAVVAGLAAMVVAADLTIEPVIPVLVLLICAAALAGFLRPDGIVTAGLGIGLALAAVHVVATLLGIEPPTDSQPPGVLGAALLVVLVVPALFASVIGGYARRTLEEERLRPR